jgi:hypothetical protein
MTTRNHKTKDGSDWQWEETPEVAEALKALHKGKFAGNYAGPLYAPHPDITQNNENQD